MENIEKGFRYMGQLEMFVTLLGGYSMFTVEDDPDSYSIGVPVLRFRESGLVPEAQEAIHNVEAEFGNDAVVWFFIHDCYKMKDEERKERFTYLLVTNESPDDLPQMDEQPGKENGDILWRAFGCTKNANEPYDSEYGEIIIRSNGGSVCRAC